MTCDTWQFSPVNLAAVEILRRHLNFYDFRKMDILVDGSCLLVLRSEVIALDGVSV